MLSLRQLGSVVLFALATACSGTTESPTTSSGVPGVPFTVRRVGPVSIARVDAELASLAKEEVVACAPIADLARTELCVFQEGATLVASLGRAAFGIEKLGGSVLDHESLAKLSGGGAIAGVDLEASALATFREKHLRVAASLGEPKSDAARRVVAMESEFWTAYVVPVILPDPERVLLGVPRSQDGTVDRQTLDHEYLHAQFFEDTRLEAAVGRCFDAAPAPRRDAVIEHLRSLAVYDVTQARLVRNEYFAYGLTGAFEGEPGLEGLRADLESCLAKEGGSPAHVR